MKRIESWIRWISLALGSMVLLAMMAQVVIDVVLRSFAGIAIPVTADLVGKYYMVAVSFLPLAMTEIDRRHIEATIFTRRLKAGPRKLIFLFGFAISIVVFLLLTWGAYDSAMRQTAKGAYIDAGTLQFPTWPSYWILPVSFALMLAVLVIRMIELLAGRFDDGEHDPLEEIQSGGTEAR